MNGEDLERWFRNNLLANLPANRNVVIVTDNVKYHNQLVEKKHSMKIRKGDMLTFMAKCNIPVPLPVPIKSVLIQKIKDHNIPS